MTPPLFRGTRKVFKCTKSSVLLCVMASPYPIFGLAAQALRADSEDAAATKSLAWGGDRCGNFLELLPPSPFDPSPFVLTAAKFLMEPRPTETEECLLATALAVTLLMQELADLVEEHWPLAEATEIVVSLLGGTSSDFRHLEARASVFYLLDRAISCPSRVRVKSPAGVGLMLRVFPFRDHVSDQIRHFGTTHCGYLGRRGIDVEAIAAGLLANRSKILVADVGAAFGHCLLPLLVDPRVEALFVEASRSLRDLIFKSVSDMGAVGRVRIMPAWASLAGHTPGLLDVVNDEGHRSRGRQTGDPEVLLADAEAASAYPATLADVVGQAHVDLLLLYPLELCRAMSDPDVTKRPLRCAGRVAETRGVPSDLSDHNHCAFLDCQVVELGSA
ncbi:unnamed protein product [Polarella glacialis]|uniref:Uncharacterized protein n=1 Tax=Polarella glacialis TaxID=89957 RepID=A0A813G9B2_POLGL|nr:unnamed protein product [Polarella glacialis]